MLAKVTVTPREGVLDPQGKAVVHSLHALGYDEVDDVRIGKYMEVRLGTSDRARAEFRVREMCDRLLANGVIEDYRFDLVDEAPR